MSEDNASSLSPSSASTSSVEFNGENESLNRATSTPLNLALHQQNERNSIENSSSPSSSLLLNTNYENKKRTYSEMNNNFVYDFSSKRSNTANENQALNFTNKDTTNPKRACLTSSSALSFTQPTVTTNTSSSSFFINDILKSSSSEANSKLSVTTNSNNSIPCASSSSSSSVSPQSASVAPQPQLSMSLASLFYANAAKQHMPFDEQLLNSANPQQQQFAFMNGLLKVAAAAGMAGVNPNAFANFPALNLPPQLSAQYNFSPMSMNEQNLNENKMNNANANFSMNESIDFSKEESTTFSDDENDNENYDFYLNLISWFIYYLLF